VDEALELREAGTEVATGESVGLGEAEMLRALVVATAVTE
jgi:hypothetical protein